MPYKLIYRKRRDYYLAWGKTEKAKEWKRNYMKNLRIKALSEIGNSCFNCGTKENLDLDHIIYLTDKTKGKKIDNGYARIKEAIQHPEIFQLLCKSCHQKKHKDSL